jgi:pimeloyl-ACP methyl ester carboxylesterase
VHRFVAAPGDSETVRWDFVESGNPANVTVVFLHGMPTTSESRGSLSSPTTVGSPLGDHLVKNAGDRVTGYARGQQHLWHLHLSLHPTQDLFLSPEAPRLLGDARRFVTTAYTWLAERSVAKSDLVRTIEEFSHPGIATAVPRCYHSSSFRQEWVDRRTDLIAGWKTPVLLLQGRGDPLQPHETGHFWPFEAPVETVAVLGDFLDHTNG